MTFSFPRDHKNQGCKNIRISSKRLKKKVPNGPAWRGRDFLNIGPILTRKKPLENWSWESGLPNVFFRVKIDPILTGFQKIMNKKIFRKQGDTSPRRNFLESRSILTRKKPLDSGESGLFNGFFRVKIDLDATKLRRGSVSVCFRSELFMWTFFKVKNFLNPC